MTAKEMWTRCCEALRISEGTYTAWEFGSDADTLAKLVLSGEKTATCSVFLLYGMESEPLPEAGEYSVVLDGAGKAVCVIRTTDVSVLPFCEVTAEMAALEGEGDRSLTYWQKEHRAFFAAELADVGLSFDEHMLVVFERFELIYKP